MVSRTSRESHKIGRGTQVERSNYKRLKIDGHAELTAAEILDKTVQKYRTGIEFVKFWKYQDNTIQ